MSIVNLIGNIANREDVRKAQGEQFNRIMKLLTDLDKCKAALAFYVTKGNYIMGPSSWVDRKVHPTAAIHTADLHTPVLSDLGKRARETLREVGDDG